MIFVTVGTQLVFPRLLNLFIEAEPELVADVFAQTADPGYGGPLRFTAHMPRPEFEAACAQATIIIGHAGMGTILAARRHCKPLIVVPRRYALGEHRNDHQMGTAAQLRALGEVTVCETAEELTHALANPPRPLRQETRPEKVHLIENLAGFIEHALNSKSDMVSIQSFVTPEPTHDERASFSDDSRSDATQQVFLGIQFDTLSFDQACEKIAERARSPGFAYVVTPNVDHVVTLHKGEDADGLAPLYRDAWLRLNDSRVLELMARASGRPLTVVPGSDLALALLGRYGDRLGTVAVVGGKPMILDKLRARYPHVEFKAHFPPYGVRRDAGARAAIVRFVKSAGADIIFFAIGAPQSELVCYELAKRRTATGVALCVGAALEFASGHKRRAPRFMQRLRLEWLFRLMQDPGRLANRYLVKGPRIFAIWLSDRHSDRVL